MENQEYHCIMREEGKGAVRSLNDGKAEGADKMIMNN